MLFSVRKTPDFRVGKMRERSRFGSSHDFCPQDFLGKEAARWTTPDVPRFGGLTGFRYERRLTLQAHPLAFSHLAGPIR